MVSEKLSFHTVSYLISFAIVILSLKILRHSCEYLSQEIIVVYETQNCVVLSVYFDRQPKAE